MWSTLFRIISDIHLTRFIFSSYLVENIILSNLFPCVIFAKKFSFRVRGSQTLMNICIFVGRKIKLITVTLLVTQYSCSKRPFWWHMSEFRNWIVWRTATFGVLRSVSVEKIDILTSFWFSAWRASFFFSICF